VAAAVAAEKAAAAKAVAVANAALARQEAELRRLRRSEAELRLLKQVRGCGCSRHRSWRCMLSTGCVPLQCDMCLYETVIQQVQLTVQKHAM
jgi:hypothetical protein